MESEKSHNSQTQERDPGGRTSTVLRRDGAFITRHLPSVDKGRAESVFHPVNSKSGSKNSFFFLF